MDTVFPPGYPNNEDISNMRAAVAADKVLLVSGYNAPKARDGVYERSGGSVGCIGEGFSEGCIWAPA